MPEWAMASPTDRILLEAVDDEGELTRARLAAVTGVPKSTLTQRVGVLLRRGVLVEGPARTSGRRGRPGTVLSLSTRVVPDQTSAAPVVLAAAFRHSSRFANGPVECALVSPDGQLLAIRSADSGSDPVASAIAASSEMLSDPGLGDVTITAAVLAVPFPLVLWRDGPPVSERARVVPTFAHVLGSAPHHRFAEALQLPTSMANDADLGAFAERTWGWGRTTDDLLYVKCLNGIGVGVVKGRRIMTAGDITTGELEHMQVDDGSACCCGGASCRGGAPSQDGVLELPKRLRHLGTSAETMTELQSAVERGERSALDALFLFGEDIGRALAAAQVLWSPAVVSIEARLGAAHGPLARGVEAGMARWGLALRSAPVRVEQSTAGVHAELRGAATALQADVVPRPRQ